MNRRVLTLIIVVVVLAGLVGAYLIVTRPKPAAAASPAVQIAQGDKEKLAKIVLTERTEGTLTLEKKGKTWTAAGAAGIALDPSSVDDIVLTFTSMSAERVIDDKPTNLAQYGLQPPRVVGEATYSDGTVKKLFLGDKTPTGNTYYLQAAGDPKVYSVWTNHGDHLHWTLADLRDKKITPELNYDEITYFKVTKGDGTTIELQQKTEKENKAYQLGFGRFLMSRPYSYPRGVDSQKGDPFIKGPQSIQISSFVDDHPADLSRYGLSRPEAEVVVRDKSNTLDFLLGSTTGDKTYFMIRGRPGVYTTDKSSLDFLKTTAWDLVDKFVFIPNIDDVDRMDVSSGGTTHSLVITRAAKKAEKKGEENTVEATYTADGKKVEEQSFKAFYQQVIAMQAEGEVRKVVPNSPVMTVKFFMNKGPSKIVTVDYAPYDNDFDAVFVDGKSEFALTKQQLAQVSDKLVTLLSGGKVTY
ncbi:MAG TPA: DUF4340 domain-containing protein [Spirochaetia bacterium]|nr:DUF4340 domain-containing protein [Spirochaetia bacterium]